MNENYIDQQEESIEVGEKGGERGEERQGQDKRRLDPKEVENKRELVG